MKGGEKYMFKKITTGITIVSLFALTTPVFAEDPAPEVTPGTGTTITVQGNGEQSVNTVVVSGTGGSKTTVVQENVTVNHSVVLAESSTGGNTIKGTTGDGGNSITTGDATASASNTVLGGNNDATVAGGCCAGDTTVTIKDNGEKSVNTVIIGGKEGKPADPTITQGTETANCSTVGAAAGTGDNKIVSTTGDGANTIATGGAASDASNLVSGGANTATIGQPCCDTQTTVKVSKNGEKTVNTVTVPKKPAAPKTVLQVTGVASSALVGGSAGTGGNKLKSITGKGTNSIVTKTSATTVTNMVVAGSNTSSL